MTSQRGYSPSEWEHFRHQKDEAKKKPDRFILPGKTFYVEDWVELALQRDWKRQGFVAFAATLLARLTGDRERDLDATLRNRVAEKLVASSAPEIWLELVTEVRGLDASDEKRIFGEGLPPGLRLVDSAWGA